MKKYILTASFVFATFGLIAQTSTGAKRPFETTTVASEPIEIGQWSVLTHDAIQGLDVRARLLYAKGTLETPLIFLELQNISRVGNTTYLYYDARAPNLTCELRDSSGKVVPPAAAVYDGPVPEVGWLALPHDSILRFRVTLPGFGQATNLISAAWSCWRLPTGETGNYYLSGELSLRAPAGETRPRVWQGTLKLPHVKIPGAKR